MSRLRTSRSDSDPTVSPDLPVSRRWRVLCRVVVLGVGAAIATAGVMVLRHTSTASADPSAQDWFRLRTCESSNNYAINTGNAHYGAYQFDLSTWRSVGG